MGLQQSSVGTALIREGACYDLIIRFQYLDMPGVLIQLLFWTVASTFAETREILDPELKHREYMISISRQLGVTCNYCHDVKNFKYQGLTTWRKSKDHMAVVGLLNSKGSALLGQKSDCYMCHRGKAQPDFKESLSTLKKEAVPVDDH